jgi:hypothetical protein
MLTESKSTYLEWSYKGRCETCQLSIRCIMNGKYGKLWVKILGLDRQRHQAGLYNEHGAWSGRMLQHITIPRCRRI